MRNLMFSRYFPKTHPRAGEPTHFVEKIWSIPQIQPMNENLICPHNAEYYFPKFHTIRAGERWKAGDYFTPRIWSKTPYRSPTIQFAEHIRVEKTWSIEKYKSSFLFKDELIPWKILQYMAKNDGLSFEDFLSWFEDAGKKELWRGQIICWSGLVNYFPETPTH